MRKLLITVLMTGAVVVATAQSDLTFRPFKFDIAVGYAIPGGSASKSGSASKGGVLLAFEPKYAISDNITFGLRVETAITLSGNENTDKVKGSGSYLATADYYLNTNTVRPFAGLGIGYFRNASVDINSEEVQSSSKLGFTPRVGIETGHFRTAVEYNFAGKTAGITNNYLGLKVGFF